jgi:hypothetical protein
MINQAAFEPVNYDLVASIAFFLVDKTDDCRGYWAGRMTKKEQIDVFGVYLGKGLICIDGEKEIVKMIVKVCFGTDTETVKTLTFAGRLFDNTNCTYTNI